MQIDERVVDGVTILDLKGKMTLGEGDELLKDKINSRMAHSTAPVITNAAATPRPVAISLLVSLRPAQWTKNLIVFTALLFGQLGAQPAFLDPHAIGRAIAAFVIFCALSGVVYLVN